MVDVPSVVTTLLLVGMLLVLGETARALAMGDMFWEQGSRRRLVVEPHVVAISILFLVVYVVPAIVDLVIGGTRPRDAASDAGVIFAIATSFVIVAAVVPLLAVTGRNTLADYGIDVRGWRAEMRFGALGYFVATPLVISLLVAMSSMRGPENEHPFLKLLAAGNSWETVGVAVAAVVAAPLLEELLFRVLFQGLLESLVHPWAAILVPAFFFAAMHGRSDAIPLFPLALVLGIVYHRRRSYLAVVTTHAMFNATFLLLALRARS